MHLPLEACIVLLGFAIDRFVQQALTESEWEGSDDVLTLFPEDVRAYSRPRRSTDRSAEASRETGTRLPRTPNPAPPAGQMSHCAQG